MPNAIDSVHQNDSPPGMPRILPLSLIEKIILIRVRMKWSTDKAGRMWGIPGSTLRGWENGNRKIDDRTAAILETIVNLYEQGANFAEPNRKPFDYTKRRRIFIDGTPVMIGGVPRGYLSTPKQIAKAVNRLDRQIVKGRK